MWSLQKTFLYSVTHIVCPFHEIVMLYSQVPVYHSLIYHDTTYAV